MHLHLIAKYRLKDKTLQKALSKNKDQYEINKVEDVQLVHYNNKIYIPEGLKDQIMT